MTSPTPKHLHSILTSVRTAREAFVMRAVREDDKIRWARSEEIRVLPKYEKPPKRKYTLWERFGLISNIMRI